MTQLTRGALLVGLGLLWVGMIVLGARTLLRYESAPATPGTPALRWPPASAIVRPADRFTLVLLAHPNCPCTRATIAELELLMARAPGKVAAFAVFSKPGAGADEVGATDLWDKAARIPGVSARFDPGGIEAARFGGRASGHVLLYDPQGRLLFSGGITSGRGHQGENPGLDALILRARGEAQSLIEFPVFGCSLRDPGADALKEDSSWRKQ